MKVRFYADVIEPIVVLTSSGKTYVVVDGIVNTNEEIYGTPVKALSMAGSVVVLITGGNLFRMTLRRTSGRRLRMV